MKLPHKISAYKPIQYPLYLFFVMIILIGILMINGYFEIQRTRSQLFNILETEALIIIKGLEKNSGTWLTDFSRERLLSSAGAMEGSEDVLSVEDLIIERLITLALQLDQLYPGKSLNPQSLKNRIGPMGLSQIYFLNPGPKDPTFSLLPEPLKQRASFFQKVLTGKSRLAVFRGEGPVRQTLPLAVAVARRHERGAILIPLSLEEYIAMGQQIIIQGFLEDFSGKGNIAFLRVKRSSGKVIAQTGEPVPDHPDPKGWRKQIRSGDPALFWIKWKGGEFLEIVRSFKPAGRDLGQVQLGLSLKEVNPILDQGRRNTVLMSTVLFVSGLIGIFFIFRLQSRHLRKLRDMEEQIRLKEELSAMGQLAAGVAHEIKNPLNAIGLVVQRLQQEFHWPDSIEQKEYERFTRIVRDEIARVNQIIGQFLMMARPPEIRLEEQSVLEILNYVLAVMEEEFRAKGIKIVQKWDEQIPPVRCDRFQLTQAFLNILNNAVEAMPDGGEILLGVKKVRGSDFGVRSVRKPITKLITRHPELHKDLVEISVSDTGRGISREGLKKIFAPYYTTKEKGVGLGLAITQKIIQAHEGILEVISTENQGTKVIIRLPLFPSRGQEAPSK
jgi:signal transduction histidine kinase